VSGAPVSACDSVSLASRARPNWSARLIVRIRRPPFGSISVPPPFRTLHKRRPQRTLWAVKVPDVQYTKSGDVNIAYQVTGEGPIDLVFVPGYVTHLELHWAIPSSASFLERLSSSSRLIRFDKRHGHVRPRGGAASLETRMDDVRAVIDAVGSRRAAFYSVSEGAAMSLLFAATYPGADGGARRSQRISAADVGA
jgi:hypothetical protein